MGQLGVWGCLKYNPEGDQHVHFLYNIHMDSEKLKRVKGAIKELAGIFSETGGGWLLGGSAGLLVNGVEVVPNDIDLVVERGLREQAMVKLGTRMRGGKDFVVNGVDGELIEFDIDRLKPVRISFEGVEVWANDLRDELLFYRKRKDKPAEVIKAKVEAIEAALARKAGQV